MRRLVKRKREKGQNQGWFESWFSTSPWLTTLISTLLEPLIIILLLLTFGPCILNRLVAFTQDHFSKLSYFTMALIHCYKEMQWVHIHIPFVALVRMGKSVWQKASSQRQVWEFLCFYQSKRVIHQCYICPPSLVRRSNIGTNIR